MALSLQQAFGPSATQAGTKITIELTDFTNLNAATATPSKALAALLLWQKANLAQFVDDPTVGVVSAADFGNTKTFITRGDPAVAQIQNSVTFNLYRSDTEATLDPDDVI